MNTIGVGEVAEPVVPVNILMLQDPIIKRVVFHVFEIQQISDHEKWDNLNAMLQIVCKKFKNVVFVYNRTPRYALAANYNTVSDIVADFKDGHLAKMLRELDLMQYWDHFKKKKETMYSFAVNLRTLWNDLSPYVRNSAHRALIIQYIAREVRAHGGR
jgi:hypothetical protein